MGAMNEPPGKAPVMVFAGYPNDMASFMLATVWKSNFGRPAPSTQRAFRSCVCAMAWRFRAIDATLSRGHVGSMAWRRTRSGGISIT